MYVLALYIGLGSLVLTHLYFTVIPYYAWQIHQGATADEDLWWHSVKEAPLAPLNLDYVGTALGFGVFWALAQAQAAPLVFFGAYSVHDLFIWFGLLWLLARIDQACLLLPDVLTQTLMWWGLVRLGVVAPEYLPTTLGAMCVIYLGGRLIQFFGNLCFAMPLVGLGDVKLLVAVTPWLGAHVIVYVLCLASTLCFVAEAIRQRCWRPKGTCAFGPYLVSASWLVWWFEPPAIYLHS